MVQSCHKNITWISPNITFKERIYAQIRIAENNINLSNFKVYQHSRLHLTQLAKNILLFHNYGEHIIGYT